MIRSVWADSETVVPAGNMLGKDFVAGFIVPAFLLTRTPCRIVTTSAKFDHLKVLWGEINWFIRNSKIPLDSRLGGPLVITQHNLRRKIDGLICPISYAIGMVSSADSTAAMQGHHVKNTGDGIPRTLFVSDESSGVLNDTKKMIVSWANRQLILGNPWDCENFFKHAVKGRPGTDDHGGDIPRPNGIGYDRRVIKITAEDSPNVKYARQEITEGKEPSDKIVIPGVKSWGEYQRNRRLWDKIQQCVSLDAEFYEGSELRLFPKEWLDRAEELARALVGKPRVAKAIGIDPAEGGDKTTMVAGDEFGVIEIISRKTPNTADITAEAIAFGRKHNVPSQAWWFDRGGGGKQHADRLREQGHPCQTVAFGESVSPDPKRGKTPIRERKDDRESRYAYKNRRAQMYGQLSEALDPSLNPNGFAIPPQYPELRQQLAPIPKKYDPEGRLKIPPKNKREDDSTELTLVELIGHSPDESDGTMLMWHGILNEKPESVFMSM